MIHRPFEVFLLVLQYSPMMSLWRRYMIEEGVPGVVSEARQRGGDAVLSSSLQSKIKTKLNRNQV